MARLLFLLFFLASTANAVWGPSDFKEANKGTVRILFLNSSGAPRSQCSGAFVSTNGYLVTAAHCIPDSPALSLRLAVGTEKVTKDYSAVLVAMGELDPVDERTDWAILKIRARTPCIPVDARTLDDEQIFSQLGFPGSHTWYETDGRKLFATSGTLDRLGAKRCTLAYFKGDDRRAGWYYQDLLPVQSQMAPGYSGGPTLSAEGKYIGLNGAISPLCGEISFSNPVKNIVAGLESLKNPALPTPKEIFSCEGGQW